jgi:hypothetical protein
MVEPSRDTAAAVAPSPEYVCVHVNPWSEETQAPLLADEYALFKAMTYRPSPEAWIDDQSPAVMPSVFVQVVPPFDDE